MANAIEKFKQYIDTLDEVYKISSVTSVLDGNNRLVKMGANANEIVIPKCQWTVLRITAEKAVM